MNVTHISPTLTNITFDVVDELEYDGDTDELVYPHGPLTGPCGAASTPSSIGAIIFDGDDDDDGPYYDGPISLSFCDGYKVHAPHVYVARNSEMYSCPGLSVEEMTEDAAYDPGTCKHGLSADLCSGPFHY